MRVGVREKKESLRNSGITLRCEEKKLVCVVWARVYSPEGLEKI